MEKRHQKDLKRRSNQHISRLSKSIHLGLRSILPVYKTTPLLILYRETGVLPPKLILEDTRLRFALRTQTLDDQHPLKKRALGKPFTRLTRTAKLLPISEDAKEVTLERITMVNKTEIARDERDIHLFTDGSQTSDRKSGGGFVIIQAGQKVRTESLGKDREAEPIDTELIAICQGISACVKSAHTRFATNIIIHTDNRTAAGI
ncbi:hypothetical protein EPUL_006712, partial [Erysiphe pulchra]